MNNIIPLSTCPECNTDNKAYATHIGKEITHHYSCTNCSHTYSLEDMRPRIYTLGNLMSLPRTIIVSPNESNPV